MISAYVPATSANLGPGFDCLGMAVSLELHVTLTPAASDIFNYSGQGHVKDTANNLIHQGFRLAHSQLGRVAPKVKLDVINPIPLARGLGSSSAALVAGIALADVLMDNALGRDGVFQLAAQLEGHPDNVASAVYGGFTVSAQHSEGHYICETLPLPEEWQLVFGVPDFELLTSEARSVLPEEYKRADAVHNASRTALWTAAVALNKPQLLQVASQDRLHEPYREPLIQGLKATREQLKEAGAVASYLSGAGPTLAAITLDAERTDVCKSIMKPYVGQGEVLALRSSGGYVCQLHSHL